MLRLRTLGAVVLERDGTPLAGRNTQRRRLALLVLLASARRRPVSRDRILALLWAERDAAHGRHALAQLVYELRRDLGTAAVVALGDEITIDDTILASDVAEFEDAIERGDAERAVSVYDGPFLDAFFVADAPEFERWAEDRRQGLAAKYLNVLETLAAASAQAGDLLRAVDYRRRAAALDPLNGRLAIAVMQALARAGDRAAALRHAQLHERMLRCEVDAPPDRDVAALAAELARLPDAQEVSPVVQPAGAPRAPGAEAAAFRESARDARPPASWANGRGLRQRGAARVGQRGAVVIALVAGLALGGALWNAHAVERTRERPLLVILGDVASSDSSLSLAVREALRAELERTPNVVVLGDAPVARTLQLMRLAATAPLTEALADDVALRTGASMVVVGRAATLGAQTNLVVRVVDPRRSATIASLSASPATATEIVPAVARLGSEVRARLDRSVVPRIAPLPAVTTSSLEALRDYALARAALARIDRQSAIAFGEAAVAQDSDFALAHYLLGDLLWYVDRERHAEQHLARAYALSAALPTRERLLVRARYTQLVLDRPDSALGFWRELRAAYPEEPLGYEGAVWSDLAAGAYVDAAAAADSALRLDSTAAPQVRNRMIALLALGDTAEALRLTRTAGARWPYLEQQVRVAEYQMRGDWQGLEHLIDSLAPPVVNSRPNPELAPTRQALLITRRRLREAAAYENVVVATMHAQFAIRAELHQARGELALGGSRPRTLALLHDAIARLDSTDLSPPATSRLAELAAGVAAAAGDARGLVALRRIVVARDAGRGLPSHRLALMTLNAADAFVQGDYARTVQCLQQASRGGFYGRSGGTLVLLEADALAREGQQSRADSLFRLTMTPGGVHDDGDTWMALRPWAERGLEGTRVAAGSRRLGGPPTSNGDGTLVLVRR